MNSNTIRLKMQREILNEVAKDYAGHTIENVISQIESRIRHFESK